MIYKNSVKILFSNFNMVWKSLLYFLLLCAITIGLVILVLNPIYQLLSEAGFINKIVEVYTDFLSSLDLNQLVETIDHLLTRFTEIVTENLPQFWFAFIAVMVVLFVFAVIASNLTIMPNANSLHYYMGSMNRHGFFSSFSETFGKNLKAQLVYFVISLPIKVINICLIILGFKLFSSVWILSIFSGFLLFLEIILLQAFKFSLFASFIPTMVVLNYGVFKSLKVSIKNTFRNFSRVFSNAIGVVLTIALINIIFGLFTFMSGLLISVPASFLLYSTFGMVVTYESQGMRYYVDVYNVITPQKRELTDKLNNMKYIV